MSKPEPQPAPTTAERILEVLERTEDNNAARHRHLVSLLSGTKDGSNSAPATKTDLQVINDKLDKIMISEQQVADVLNKIDVATTKIATNVQVEADGLQTISGEMDKLQSALAAALAAGTGVSQALVDQANTLQTKVQAASDALDAQVPVLQAIAAKGVTNPVPVPVPPPTSPVPPGAIS